MGKKKTKTGATESSHTVTTPTQPDWVSQGAQGLNARIQQLGTTNPADSVAPLSALEQKAMQGAGGLSTTSAGPGGAWFTGGSGSAFAVPGGWTPDTMQAPTVTGASLLDNLSAYQNPYRDQVVNTAMADFDASAGRTRAQQDLDLAGQGAFGGSGAALARSLTEGELARGRNSQLAGLLSNMFTTSAGLAGQDADRRQAAGLANAQLAQQMNQSNSQLQQADALARDQMRQQEAQFQSQQAFQLEQERAKWAQAQAQFGLDQDANSRANLGLQASLGQQARAVDQALRDAPAKTLAQQVDMFSGLPLSLFQGQSVDSTGQRSSTETSSGASIGEIAQLVSSLAGLKR